MGKGLFRYGFEIKKRWVGRNKEDFGLSKGFVVGLDESMEADRKVGCCFGGGRRQQERK